MLRNRPLTSFVLLAYAFTWLVMLPLLLQRRGLLDFGLPEAWEALAAFGPFLSAWIVLRANTGTTWRAEFIASLTRWPRTAHGWWLTVGSPFVFLGFALLFEAARIGGMPPLATALRATLGSLHALIDLLLIGALLQSTGEEPGWRGFMLPRLRERFAPLTATLVLFPIWLLWHLPMFLSRPQFGIAQFGGFALGILSAAVWLTAVRESSHSTLAAVLWHVLANTTRGVALAISPPAFLAYGMAVTLGAIYYAVRLARGAIVPPVRRVPESP